MFVQRKEISLLEGSSTKGLAGESVETAVKREERRKGKTRKRNERMTSENKDAQIDRKGKTLVRGTMIVKRDEKMEKQREKKRKTVTTERSEF